MGLNQSLPSDVTLVSPGPGGTGPVKCYAPFKYLHPVQVIRRYLGDIGTVSEADYGVGRVKTVDSRKPVGGAFPAVPVPVSQPDPTIVQPPQGAGPMFFNGTIGH